MLYYIQANVKRKTFGISSERESIVTKLVNADNTGHAKLKFEYVAGQMFAKETPEAMSFDYLVIADEIK